MTRRYVPADVSFFDEAPSSAGAEVELDCTPPRLFGIFEDAEAWPKWLDLLKRAEWTSPQPFGVGTTRPVDLTPAGHAEADWPRGGALLRVAAEAAA